MVVGDGGDDYGDDGSDDGDDDDVACFDDEDTYSLWEELCAFYS